MVCDIVTSNSTMNGFTVHNDNHGAKRMRKLTQRKAVDYTSTVVRYMQVMITALLIIE